MIIAILVIIIVCGIGILTVKHVWNNKTQNGDIKERLVSWIMGFIPQPPK